MIQIKMSKFGSLEMPSRKTFIYPLVIVLLLTLLAETNLVGAILSNSEGGNSSLGCTKKERNALLSFKEGLNDSSNSLSSWVGEDCCTNWLGVVCSNQTGRVTTLDLHHQFLCNQVEEGNETTFSCKEMLLGGKLSPSLLDLKYLTYLDLSGNDFRGIPVPSFISSLTNLRYLDLSDSNFAGMVPPSLGNLSKLVHLDLKISYSNPTASLWISDLNWLPNLSSLQYLHLGGVNLSKSTTNWLQAVNMLPLLLELHLPLCNLHYIPQSLPSINFTSLSVLDLSYNHFDSLSIPHWCFNITSLVQLTLSSTYVEGPIPKVSQGYLCNLQSLDLSGNFHISGEIEDLINTLSKCSNVSLEVLDLSSNNLRGNLPNALGYLKHLKQLDLSYNLLSGSIPASIGNLSNLEELHLSNNNMNTIAKSIGHLSSLVTLDLFWNPWEGVINEVHFQNLSQLFSLTLSSPKSSLVFDMPQNWIPPFNLYTLSINGCKVGPAFPAWLRSQTSLTDLTLSNVAISGSLPGWFWDLSPQIEDLDLSHKNLRGDLPSSSYFSSLWFLDLSFNEYEGSVPLWNNITFLYLSNNLFSGPIPSEIGHEMPNLKVLDLSSNFLNGSIPPSINRLKNLSYLYLSNSQLSGEIHNHWESLGQLQLIDLSKNNLTGGVPSSMCSLPYLYWLQLSNNSLFGNLSLSLQDCRGVSTLDLGGNKFSGPIPKWIGERLVSTAALRLRSNFLSGNIPEELCHLSSLHVLDLAHNNLSGSIPACLGKLEGFQNSGLYIKLPPSEHQHPSSYVDLVLKGRQDGYADQLVIVYMIDLSVNSLSGEIPTTLTNLSRLITLNLSMNLLTGKIPEKIGDLTRLETIDLSWNHLEGPIPESMSSLTFLSHLNLSYNNLSGPIPFSNQLNSIYDYDPSIYEGNLGLCGPPLPNMCSASGHTDGIDKSKEGLGEEDEDGHDKLWFYVSMGLGFIVGFWAVCGSFVIKESWRHSYVRFIDNVKEKLLLIIALNVARLQRKMEMGRLQVQ